MSTQEKVTEIIVEQLGVKVEEVKSKSRFQKDLGVDSFDTIKLIMALEEEFAIEIPDADAEKAKTVQDVINYIDKRLKQKAI